MLLPNNNEEIAEGLQDVQGALKNKKRNSDQRKVYSLIEEAASNILDFPTNN